MARHLTLTSFIECSVYESATKTGVDLVVYLPLNQVKLESNFASIVFAIMVLEGLGRSLDPNLDILELAKPLLLKNAASLL